MSNRRRSVREARAVVVMPADDGPDGAAADDEQGLYRVDALSELTGISVRNIREYQDRGLLTPPRRAGRVALYSNDHVVRLRLIERLLQRGYTIAVIRDLLEAWSEGRNLEQVLGLETVVSEPWTDESASTVTIFELRRMFGWQLTPSIIRRAVRMGILHPLGPRKWDVPSPNLLQAGKDLVASGIPLRTVLDVIEKVAVELDRPADRLIEMVFDHVFPVDAPGGLPQGPEMQQLTDTVAVLRPHALKAVDALFAQSIVRAVDERFGQLTDRAMGVSDGAGQHAADGLPEPG